MVKDLILISGVSFMLFVSMTPKPVTEWVCKPCGIDCDKIVHSSPGECEHCHMPLVDSKTVYFKNIPISQICDKLKDGSVITLDVRTPQEFNGTAPENFGRIKGAINIPIQEIEKRVGELEQYKNKEILVYCSHSHRSPQVAWYLNQQGFKKVDNMASGMSVWQDSVKCENFRIK